MLERRSAKPAWISFGVAAGAAVSAGVFGIATLRAKSRFDREESQIPAAEARSDFRRNRTGFLISVGVTLAGAALGAWLYPRNAER